MFRVVEIEKKDQYYSERTMLKTEDIRNAWKFYLSEMKIRSHYFNTKQKENLYVVNMLGDVETIPSYVIKQIKQTTGKVEYV